MTQHCACCGRPFEPRPQVPDQAYCSAPDCQRARKRQWQRAKHQSDPDYRINQRAAQQAWSQRNQDYWRNYREDRPEYVQRNREQQRLRDANGADVDLAKMHVCDTNLRVVASKEQVNVMGTIGLLCAMIENQLLTVDDAFKALDRMKLGKRRLPWPEAEKVLNALR
ncbi:MAG TPA: hypothetical protein PKH69_08425 [Thiobacillaceae bacterium]|nr:hypothetical protein [Thiobacillaceae bacterium]